MSGRPPKPWVLVLTTKSPVNCLLKMSRTDALIDAASTEMPATRATPTMSAAAVRAVRFGLRMAFSCASRPAMPRMLRQRRADDAGERPGDQRPEHEDADEDEGDAEPEGGDRARSGRRR